LGKKFRQNGRCCIAAFRELWGVRKNRPVGWGFTPPFWPPISGNRWGETPPYDHTIGTAPASCRNLILSIYPSARPGVGEKRPPFCRRQTCGLTWTSRALPIQSMGLAPAHRTLTLALFRKPISGI